MTLTDLIEKAEVLKAKYGDLEVGTYTLSHGPFHPTLGYVAEEDSETGKAHAAIHIKQHEG